MSNIDLTFLQRQEHRKQVERKTEATVNERTVLERSSSQIQSTFIKAMALTEVHRRNGLKIKHS